MVMGIALILIAGVVTSRIAFEVTQTKWYSKVHVASNGIELCNEWESSSDISQYHNKYSEAIFDHFSTSEVFLLACEGALSKQQDNETHKLKVATAHIRKGTAEIAVQIFGQLKEKESQATVINKLIEGNYLPEAEQLMADIDNTALSNKLANAYLKNKDYVKAEILFKLLLEKGLYSGYYGMKKVYDGTNRFDKSVMLLNSLLELEISANLDPSNTYAHLSFYYDNGVGVTKNLTVAREYYEKGANSLSSIGKERLAEMFYKGIGGSADSSRAIKLGYKTPEMRKIEKIKSGLGYIERGTYTCLYFNSISKLTRMKRDYGSLQYIKRAIPDDCIDLTSYGNGVDALPIKQFVSMKGDFLQLKFAKNGDSAWVHLNSVHLK